MLKSPHIHDSECNIESVTAGSVSAETFNNWVFDDI